MKVTLKGQVTIPQYIRDKLGITPSSEIEFQEEKGRVYLVKKDLNKPNKNIFKKHRGSATIKMTTDEILSLTRDDE